MQNRSMPKRSQQEVLESIDGRLDGIGRLNQVLVFLFIFLAVTLVFIGAQGYLMVEIAAGIAAILIFWAVKPRGRSRL